MNGIRETTNTTTPPLALHLVACVGLCWLLLPGCVSGPPCQVQIQRPSSQTPAEAELPQTSTSKALHVTTFNVWGLPKWLNGASSDRYGKILKQLDQTGSDVVLLQEVWTHRSFSDLSKANSGSCRNWWTASARNRGTFVGQNGLLTLSRYPIIGAAIKHFSSARLPDSLMHKGALKVTVRLAGGEKINIWNVHLQDGQSGGVRERQISELIGWINEANNGQVADVVAGDFNSTPNSREFSALVAGIGPDVHQIAGDKPFSTWDGLKLGAGAAQSLDHIFIRLKQPDYEILASQKRLFAEPRLQDRLSDHMAMEASLTFSNVLETLPPVLLGQTPVVNAQ